MHAQIAVSGLPHGIEKFEKSYDQLDVPGGKFKLRPIRLYDSTFPGEAYPWFLREFYCEPDPKDDMPKITGVPFQQSQHPIKLGRLRKATWFCANLFGAPFGYHAPDYDKVDLSKPFDGPHGVRENIHTIVTSVARDNYRWNSAHGKWEEWI